jgi:hypothetical protein
LNQTQVRETNTGLVCVPRGTNGHKPVNNSTTRVICGSIRGKTRVEK